MIEYVPPAILKAFEVVLILLVGVTIVRLFSIACSPITKKPGMAKILVKTIEYLLFVATIFIAVFFLDPGITERLLASLSNYAPILLSTLLILILGTMIVNLIMEILTVTFRGMKFQIYLKGMGIDEPVVNFVLMGLRLFLYIIVIQISLAQLGIPKSVVESSLSAISYGFAFLVVALIFFASKDITRNWLAGFYIKSSKLVKLGQRIFVDDADGEVIDISSTSVIIDTGRGYYISIPNAKIVEKEVRIKKSRFDIKTMESMRRHYVAQEKSYCVPAVLNMILDLFGFHIEGGQKTIAKEAKTKVPGGTTVSNAIKAVDKLTKGNVAGIFVPYKEIINLRDEVRAWLSEGGLVVLNFYKAALFPGVKRDQKHAVLCVGVEGDELLIIDPNKETGGVYLVNYKDMERAMGPFEGEERGYVVYAPRGTKAYWRIKNKLYYSDPIHYKKISKGLERKLKQIFRESKRVKDVFPEYLREFLDEYRAAETERIERLWKP
ncbi:MAG: mechanosensitive ion channel [Candidatus Diapherotrites archaeon]|nr:mechanosensitive ion channel [Candidatus Diapherotrites archaeon]